MNVSVVVPAWNAADTLGQTLDSLIAQTHKQWNAVVVDDGSTDNTADLALDYAAHDTRFRVIRQRNLGEAGARNTGIAACDADWMLFLDADDWIAPAFLEQLTAALVTDASLDAAYCGYARVAADGTLVFDPYVAPAGDMFATWARRSAFPVHCCIVRRALVNGVGGFDTSLRKSADWDLWQRIARTGARFGAVRESLAFYRMRPCAASLEADQMLRDGLRVIRRGHAPDARVRDPHPSHACGEPTGLIRTQAWYLLSWCAGLFIGRGQDARSLIDLCDVEAFPEISATAVAQCIFDAALLPRCEPSNRWVYLWPDVHSRAAEFLSALEAAVAAPGLGQATYADLRRRVLRAAPAFSDVIDELEAGRKAFEAGRASLEAGRASLEQSVRDGEEARRLLSAELSTSRVERDQLQQDVAAAELACRQLADERATLHRHVDGLNGELDDLRGQIADLHRQIGTLGTAIQAGKEHAALLQSRNDKLTSSLRLASSEHDNLRNSPEHRAGDLLLNRLGLRRPLGLVGVVTAHAAHRFERARLQLDRRTGSDQRIAASICWNFPVHSQTFVYEELTQLMNRGFKVRHIYSKSETRDQLHDRFMHLWPARRRLVLHEHVHQHDFRHYRRRMPGRVDALVSMISEAACMPVSTLTSHGNFLEAFSFTRMVDAYRPDYLHSYFFYDRSLMSLIAGYLLGIPRGISCYSDHVLHDYELKVVPLHMELCAVVIATSDRIRSELLSLAPATRPDKILVKPNGIDARRFEYRRRSEPGNDEPFRIVSVSRIEPKKGLLDLVDAVDLLRRRGVHVEAHIVGAADQWNRESVAYRQSLDQRITDLDLWGTVHLEGRLDHAGVSHFHRMAQLFVAPFVETESGDKDGIPTAMLEGMATGLPAVATDAGSITEVIDDGVDGLIVPQRHPDALADAIERLLRNPGLRGAMGAAAAGKIRDRFDVATCEQAFHDRLNALLAPHGRV